MSLVTLLIIVLLILVIAGTPYGYRNYGTAPVGLSWILVIIVIVLLINH